MFRFSQQHDLGPTECCSSFWKRRHREIWTPRSSSETYEFVSSTAYYNCIDVAQRSCAVCAQIIVSRFNFIRQVAPRLMLLWFSQ